MPNKYILDTYYKYRGRDYAVDILLSMGGVIGSIASVYFESVPGAIVSVGALVIFDLKESLKYKNAFREALLDVIDKGEFSKLEEIADKADKDNDNNKIKEDKE